MMNTFKISFTNNRDIKYKLKKGHNFEDENVTIKLSDLLSVISEEYREMIKDIIITTDADVELDYNSSNGLEHAYKIVDAKEKHINNLNKALDELSDINVKFVSGDNFMNTRIITAKIPRGDVVVLNFTYPAMHNMREWQKEIEKERVKDASKNKALNIIKTDAPAGLDDEIVEKFNEVNLLDLISNALLGSRE